MLIKTPEFTRRFINEFIELVILSKKYKEKLTEINRMSASQIEHLGKIENVEFIGSFTKKKYGSYITDIDVRSLINVNDAYLKRIIYIVNNSKNFSFIRLYTGQSENIEVPWDIFTDYDCKFNLSEIKTWLEKIKIILPFDKFADIKKILDSDSLSIKDLYDVEEIIKSVTGISWTKEDINKGFRIVNGKKFYFEDEIKKKSIKIFKFLYKYDNEYCIIDYALGYNVDEYVKRIIKHNQIYHYFGGDYKKLVLIRYYIKDEFQDEYKKKFFELLSPITAILAKNEMIDKIVKYNILDKNKISKMYEDLKKYSESIGLETIDAQIIKKKLDNTSKNLYSYFKTKIKPEHNSIIGILDIRSLKTHLKIKKDILKLYDKSGYCPFFIYNTDMIKKIVDISNRSLSDYLTLFTCLINLRVINLGNIFTSQYYKIQKTDNKYLLLDKQNNIVRQSENLNLLRKTVLFGLDRE